MGGRRRLLASALLLMLAASLPVALLQFSVRPAKCSYDYCQWDWSVDLVVPLRFVYRVVDTNEVVPIEHPPMGVRLRNSQLGLYARPGVPKAVAVGLGIALPPILIWWAVWLLVPRRRKTGAGAAF